MNIEGKFCYHTSEETMSEKFDTIEQAKTARDERGDALKSDSQIYRVSHPCDFLRPACVADIAFENIVENLDCEYVCGEEPCLCMSAEDKKEFGRLIIDFIRERADVNLYGCQEVHES